MAIYIYYHSSDLDGHCSGAIAKYYYEHFENKQVIMKPINYEDKFPWSEIKKEDTVVFVDFALQPNEDMIKLHYKCNLIWIDHHKSAIEAVNKKGKLKGIQDTKNAGCELTWKWFLGNHKMPTFVKLLGHYDIWDESDKDMWNDKILPFQFGMKSYKTDPSGNNKLSELLKNYFLGNSLFSFETQTIDIGKRIQQYQENIDESYIKGSAYPIELEGYKCIAANYRGNSNSFKSVWDEKKYDMMVMYYHVGGKGLYTISFYTTKDNIDCSEVAKKFGGGGHMQASGAQIKKLPWIKE